MDPIVPSNYEDEEGRREEEGEKGKEGREGEADKTGTEGEQEKNEDKDYEEIGRTGRARRRQGRGTHHTLKQARGGGR
jgi:hypothetical protein